MEIRLDDLGGQQVQDLLVAHLAGMQENSPADSVHALDLTGLFVPEISVYTARQGGQVIGVGALKQLSAYHGEIKSMRTDSRHLRKGVGLSILNHVIDVARSRGYRRLSLETGSGDQFEPALCLYRNRGFCNGAAFGGYLATEFNQFLHLEL